MATGTHAAILNSIQDAAQSRIKTGVFADAAASFPPPDQERGARVPEGRHGL